MDESGSVLPPGVDLLWGRRDRTRRGGPRPALNLERIVAAAVELADMGGLPALSMGRVAEKLGFTTMSLYRYVASKDELLMLALDAAAGSPPDLDPAGGWRVEAERWTRASLEAIGRHPWMLQVPISGPPVGPNNLRWLDRGLASLAGTALTEEEKTGAVLLLAMYARNQAQLATELLQGARAAREAGMEPPPFGHLLRQLIDADGYPALCRAVAAGVFDGAGDYTDEDFDFGLQRILDGIEALHHARGASSQPPDAD